MANTIELAKKYSGILDKVYKQSAKTAVLEGNNDATRLGANAHEILIPKMDMDGLADYDRSGGYTDGNVNFEYETKSFNYERGRMFTVDTMDNEETQELAFGQLAGEFVRTKAVPELDAFRFATLASYPGIGSRSAALSTGANVISAIRGATQAMDEGEVDENDRYLFITPTLYGMIEDLDTYKSKAVLSRFVQVITVPQTRFYSAITLLDGTTAGEEAGGYSKRAAVYTLTTDVAIDSTKTYYTKSGDTYTAVASPDVADIATYYEMTTTAGVNLNFLAVSKASVLAYSKHIVSKIITPDVNQTSDGWKYAYRSYGITEVYDNKKAGIFAHLANS